MATATTLTDALREMRDDLAEHRKGIPSLGQVHVDIGLDEEDDYGNSELEKADGTWVTINGNHVLVNDPAAAKSDKAAVAAINKKLNAVKGTKGIDSRLGDDPDLRSVASRGEFFGKAPMPTDKSLIGQNSECHWNVAKLYARGKIDAIGTGYAMMRSGFWGQHTWGIKDGKIVETTPANLGTPKYYGFVMSDKEASGFAKWAKSNPPDGGYRQRESSPGVTHVITWKSAGMPNDVEECMSEAKGDWHSFIWKYDDSQSRDSRGRFGAGTSAMELGSAQTEHDRLKDHPARESNASQTAHDAFAKGVDKFGDRADRIVQQNMAALMSQRTSTPGVSAYRAAKNQVDAGREMLAQSHRFQGDERMWRVDTALSSFHSALLVASKVMGSKWVGKSADHVLKSRVYMPPIEVHRAAKSAWDAGMSVVGITDALAESRGLDYANVQMIAEFFRASESATMPDGVRNSYGGVNAAKWADKVISKAAREWEPWIGVDLDGTLAMPTQSYDGTAIGAPIKAMVGKVRSLLASGKKVRVFTARVADDPDGAKERAIRAWCDDVIGQALPVTNEKDPGMVELWDDRAHNPDEVAKAGSGIMVAFMLDKATADKLAVPGGEDPADMHVTLAYLGKPGAVDMSKMPALRKAVEEYAAEHAPVSGTIDGPVRFGAKPQTEGRDVCVAAFCNPGIQEFRAGLVGAIKAVGVDVPRPFDYRPHVCVKYIPVGEDMPVQRIPPTPVTFGAVTLSVGGERESFPLSGIVVKYSPDQPRSEDGKFGGASDHGMFGTADAMSPPHGGFISPKGKYTAKGVMDTHDTLARQMGIGVNASAALAAGYVRHNLSGGQNNYEAVKSAAAIKLILNHIRSLNKDDIVIADINPGKNVHAMYGTAPQIRQRLNEELRSVNKYSPDQPRASNGEFGSGGGARPRGSDRVERARKSFVLIGTKEQATADKTEQKLADALGVPRTRDNSAFDLRNDDVGIEVKTLLSNTNDKITMNKSALGRKLGEAAAEGLRTFTVVADMRGRTNAQYYVTDRLGSLRLGGMTKVSLKELRDMVRA